MRFLASILLLQLNILALGFMLAWGSGLMQAYNWRAEVVQYKYELNRRNQQHHMLLDAIRKEGLWKRLGLDGQPWMTNLN